MSIQSSTGLILECRHDSTPITCLTEAQEILKKFRTGLWPIPLQHIPNEIKELLKKPVITDTESNTIQVYFQLQKKDLLKKISDAGRKPGKCEVMTTCLLVVAAEGDYSAYDRLHVNESTTGVGVNEVIQMLSGHGYVFHQILSNGDAIRLTLNCLDHNQGWLLSYYGGMPHISSVSSAEVGTKILIQLIEPKQWALRYT